MQGTLRLSYRPKAWLMLVTGGFFAACTAMLVHVASGNDRGAVLNGIVRLNVVSATAFYWVLAACSAGFVVLAVGGTIRSFGKPKEVVLDDVALSAPKSPFGNTIVTVPLADITTFEVTKVASNVFLVVHHAGGKLTVNRSMLPSRADFDRLADELEQRCFDAVARTGKAAA